MRKKLFATLLAVMLALSLCSVAAYAARGPDPPTLDPSQANTVSLPILYKVNQDGSVNPETTVSFTLASKCYYTDPSDDSPEYEPDVSIPAVTVADVTFTAGYATVAGKTMDAEFNIPVISKCGVYEYTYDIAVDHLAASAEYASVVLRVSVFNTNEPNSKQMAVDFVVTKPGTTTDPETGDPVLVKEKIGELELEYKAYNYSITKTVDGNFGDRAKEFAFTVTLDPPATGYPEVTVEYGKSGQTQTVTLDGRKELSFSLKHGETFTVKNLPETAVVTTTEADYLGDRYETTIGGVKTRTTSYTVTGNGSVTVVNTKEGSVDSGIIVESLPYIIAVVLVVACGIVFFVIKSRRESDDSEYDDSEA